jgi:hypothetical protein
MSLRVLKNTSQGNVAGTGGRSEGAMHVGYNTSCTRIPSWPCLHPSTQASHATSTHVGIMLS